MSVLTAGPCHLEAFTLLANVPKFIARSWIAQVSLSGTQRVQPCPMHKLPRSGHHFRWSLGFSVVMSGPRLVFCGRLYPCTSLGRASSSG